MKKILALLSCVLLVACATPPAVTPAAPQIVEVTRIVQAPAAPAPLPPAVPTVAPTATPEPTVAPTETVLFSRFDASINGGPGNRASCSDLSREFVFSIVAVRPITAILVMEQPDGTVIKKSHRFLSAGEQWDYTRSLNIAVGHWVVGIRLWGTEQTADGQTLNYGPWYNNFSDTFSCR